MRNGNHTSALLAQLDTIIERQKKALGKQQKKDGHWVYRLEADVTVPADVIFMHHVIGICDDGLLERIARYIRRCQMKEGGWALFHGGDCDLTASVKAYVALKLVGDSKDAPHMERARDAIAKAGGVMKAQIFARIPLVLFGFLPWRAIPVLPVEWIFLPRWAPFHLSKVSYWSRVTIVPLMILMALKPKAANPNNVTIDELFSVSPHSVKRYNVNTTGTIVGYVLLLIDDFLRFLEPIAPPFLRRMAVRRAFRWCVARANGVGGLGGILPPMVYLAMVCHFLGLHNHKAYTETLEAIRLLIVEGEYEGEVLCQSCVSPVWDTGLVMHAQLEAGVATDDSSMREAASWLMEREVRIKGDWAIGRPQLAAGGWAFQYLNDHYPDVDDTAVVAMALDRMQDHRYEPVIRRAEQWILGMQSQSGGWGAFEADNDYQYFNHIPFNDHGALLDPPTADVSARCISFLAQRGYDASHPVMKKAIGYLKKEQEDDGSWYGRWGTNYIYGTWSAISALVAVGEDAASDAMRRAVTFLCDRQNDDGGWGESCRSYWQEQRNAPCRSTPSQTSWAMLGLMSAGEIDNQAVQDGIAYLMARAPTDGADRWQEDDYTAVGFPRVFYLRYHGYSAYFPLYALARYRHMTTSNSGNTLYGI